MSILKKEVCQNVDNAVVWFVGARFARPKTVCFVYYPLNQKPLYYFPIRKHTVSASGHDAIYKKQDKYLPVLYQQKTCTAADPPGDRDVCVFLPPECKNAGNLHGKPS